MKPVNKVIKIALIIVIACIALGLVFFLAFFIHTGANFEEMKWYVNASTYNTTINETIIEGKDINKLSIHNEKGSYDVIVKRTDEKDIRIKEVIQEGETFAAIEKNADGTLNIRSVSMKPKFFSFWIGGNTYTEIWLPKEFSGDLEVETTSADITLEDPLILSGKADLKASSGEIYIKKLIAEEINLSANSGDVTLEDSKGKITISTSSGEIYADKLVAEEIKLSANSGDITLKEGEGVFNIAATSGEVFVSNIIGCGEITTNSGSISAEIKEMNGNISVTATSGEVLLKLPSTPGFTLEAKATSGEIATFFDETMKYNKKGNEAEGTVGTASELQVKVRTNSGDISVEKW